MITYTFPADEGIRVTLKEAYPGSDTFRYTMYLDGEMLFDGTGYRPSTFYVSEEEIALGLLLFLTMRVGDTDGEYFADYTQEQLAWATSTRCEFVQYEVESRLEEIRG